MFTSVIKRSFLFSLIAAISDQFLEVYELVNYNCASEKDSSTETKRLIDVKTILITRLNLNILKDSVDSSWSNNAITTRWLQ